jgi:putative intracellular protease/amidase
MLRTRFVPLASLALAAALNVGCGAAPVATDGQASAALDEAAPAGPSVLIVVSAANTIPVQEDFTGRVRTTAAGYFLSELGFPLERLLDAGARVTFATPGGVPPTMDHVSDTSSLLYYWSADEYQRIRDLVTSQPGMQAPRALASIGDDELQGFDALFIPGGHAPMTDLSHDADMARVLRHFHANGKPTGSLCHGPSAFLSTRDPSDPAGTFLYAGYRMTAISDGEEHFQELLNVYDRFVHLTWYVEDGLRASGASYEQNLLKWTSRVVVDRELLTGENPQSARDVGEVFTQMVLDDVAARRGAQ